MIWGFSSKVSGTGGRIPAVNLEQTVASAVCERVTEIAELANQQRMAASEQVRLEDKAALALVNLVRIAPGKLEVALCARRLKQHLETDQSIADDKLAISLPFAERRRGVEMKMVVEGSGASIDQKLLRNVALANRWYAELKSGHDFEKIASEAGTSKRRVQQIVELAFLAPDITRDITKGTQPIGLTSDWCIRHALPAEWQEQRERIAAL